MVMGISFSSYAAWNGDATAWTQGDGSEIINVKTWITSGNFININQYNKINGFKEELFIDYVDFDLCHQFYKKNIKIGVIPNIKIQHQIGKPITKMFLWRKFNCMNHSPIRYYYRYSRIIQSIRRFN